jgi:hypothetical protein
MRKMISLFVIAAAVMLLSSACVLIDLSRFYGAYPEEPGSLLFQDNFTDPRSGWDRVRTEEGMTDYDVDKYRIVVNARNADYWANPGLDFEDIVVTVETLKLSGPDDNNYGVLCRYQDRDNFYFLVISSDGYYGIGKVENGQQRLLQPEQMYPSDAILQGNQYNNLKVVCDGSRLALTVNGELVAETEDQAFRRGDVGLMVGSFDEPGVDVLFDHFTVTVP